MLKIKREGKGGHVRLSQGISVGFSKELLLALAAVIFLHLLFFALIDTKKEIVTTPVKRTIALTAIAEETDEPVAKESINSPFAKNLIQNAFDRSGQRSLIAHFSSERGSLDFFEEPSPPIQEWLDAFSREEHHLKSAPRYYPEVEFHPLGNLARLSPYVEKKARTWDENAVRYQCLYEICIEGKSGSVIFTRLVNEGAPSRVLKKAEKALISLQFPLSKPPLIKGFIEVIVTTDFAKDTQ